MDKKSLIEEAKILRADQARNYSCSQAALVPFAEAAGLDRETAYRISANFGGGMRRAATCGAVTGCLMALGLCGVDDPAAVKEFHRRIKENHEGCLECADLLRINREKGGQKKPHCDGMVLECVGVAADILKEKGIISE